MLVAAGVSQKLKQICTYRTKGTSVAYKQKQKPETLWEKGIEWDKIGKSPNQKQKLRQETNHMEKRKKRNQKPETERRNKSCRRKKKRKKERDLTLTSVMWVLKSELSHLMREASCTSFIGGA